MRELRPDQSETLDRIRYAVAQGKRRICVQAPTGFGKTVLAACIVDSARSKGKRVMFTVPAIDLVDQTVCMFADQGHRSGIIQAKHIGTDWSLPVQVASVQTLMKKETLPEAQVVMVDECHKWFNFYAKWFRSLEWLNTPFIGLSATPWTKGLGAYYDEYIVAATIEDMVDAGLLSRFKVYAPPLKPILNDIPTVAGDYHEGQLSERMQQAKLIADAVDTWGKLAEGRPTLCYGVDRAHAKHLQTRFEAAGIPCAYQDAFTTGYERKAIRERFHAGLVKVVCNVGTLTTGIDWDVRCISLCRPTKSDMLLTQIIGRGLRTAEGKDHCLILDHSTNHARLGFVTDIDTSYTGLHDGREAPHAKRTENIPLPKECPKCHFMKAPRTGKCPVCGFAAAAPGTDVEHAPGELRELHPKPKKAKPAPLSANLPEPNTFFAELRAYGMIHGYRDGWAARQYKEKFGGWPPRELEHSPPAGTISRETKAWIKHRMIAYHKAGASRWHHAR